MLVKASHVPHDAWSRLDPPGERDASHTGSISMLPRYGYLDDRLVICGLLLADLGQLALKLAQRSACLGGLALGACSLLACLSQCLQVAQSCSGDPCNVCKQPSHVGGQWVRVGMAAAVHCHDGPGRLMARCGRQSNRLVSPTGLVSFPNPWAKLPWQTSPQQQGTELACSLLAIALA